MIYRVQIRHSFWTWKEKCPRDDGQRGWISKVAKWPCTLGSRCFAQLQYQFPHTERNTDTPAVPVAICLVPKQDSLHASITNGQHVPSTNFRRITSIDLILRRYSKVKPVHQWRKTQIKRNFLLIVGSHNTIHCFKFPTSNRNRTWKKQ